MAEPLHKVLPVLFAAVTAEVVSVITVVVVVVEEVVMVVVEGMVLVVVVLAGWTGWEGAGFGEVAATVFMVTRVIGGELPAAMEVLRRLLLACWRRACFPAAP